MKDVKLKKVRKKSKSDKKDKDKHGKKDKASKKDKNKTSKKDKKGVMMANFRTYCCKICIITQKNNFFFYQKY